jgi:hypothetical protein
MKTENIQEVEVIEQKKSLLTLKPFDIAKAELIQLVNDYSNLVITEETIEEAKKARQIFQKKRYDIQNTLKDNKAVLNKLKDNQEAMAEELISITRPTEDKIDSGIKAIENKKAEEKAKKEKEAAERIENRKKALYSLGMTFNGASFILGERTVSDLMITGLNDNQFDILLRDVQSESEMIKAQKEKEEQLAKQEQERIAAQKAEQDRIAKEQAEKEKALKAEEERIAKEKAAFKQQVINSRIDQLNILGFTSKDTFLTFENFSIDYSIIEKYSNDQWSELVQQITPQIAKIKEENARIEAELKEKEAAKAKEEAELQAKLKAEREESLKTDKEKLLGFAKGISIYVSNCQPKELQDSKSQELLEEAIDRINGAVSFINFEIKNL